MQRFLATLAPFIAFGILAVVFVLGLMLFSYLLVVGALVGLVLFAIQRIREKCFRSKLPNTLKDQPRSGRTFDHQD